MTQKEKINKLEINYATMEEKVDNLCDTTKRIENKLDGFIKESKDCFAAKWVEKGMTGFIGALLLWVLYNIILNGKL